jgi:hypothetical protein
MIFKIYLAISISTYIMFLLNIKRMTKAFKERYHHEQQAKFINVFKQLKLLFVCFIPLFHIVLFFTYIGFIFTDEQCLGSKIFNKLDEEITKSKNE